MIISIALALLGVIIRAIVSMDGAHKMIGIAKERDKILRGIGMMRNEYFDTDGSSFFKR